MKGCGKCPWCYPVPFVNPGCYGMVTINVKYWCAYHGDLCANITRYGRHKKPKYKNEIFGHVYGECSHPGGKGLKGPSEPLSHYAKKKGEKR